MKQQLIKQKKKRKDNAKYKFNRYGVMLVLLLAVLIFVINVISVSYSWFSPLSQSGSSMKFDRTSQMRSENCSFTLYEGTVDEHGAITYNKQILSTGTASDTLATGTSVPTVSSLWDTEVAGKPELATSVPDVSFGLKYYRIIVQNNDTANASDVSLYFNNVPGGVTIGIVRPTNSTYTYSNATSDVNLVRNAYVKKKVMTEIDPGMLYVEFYIRNTGSGAFNFNENSIYLLYN